MKSHIRPKSVTRFAPALFFNSKLSSLAFSFIAFFLLILTLSNPRFMFEAKMTMTDMVSPVLSVFVQPIQNISQAVGSISGITSLRAENSQLKAENVRLKEWYQTALMLQAENHSLQELLNLQVNPTHKYVTARVISDTNNTYVKTTLIAVGHDEGVKKNQAVLAGDGMIGRVVEVGRNASRVLLLTDINSRIPVLIEGTSQKAILAGDNSEFPELKHLPKDIGVIERARVITSGHGGIFPTGLPIGRIVKKNKNHYVVRTFVDMSKVNYVRVVDSSDNKNLIRADDQLLD